MSINLSIASRWSTTLITPHFWQGRVCLMGTKIQQHLEDHRFPSNNLKGFKMRLDKLKGKSVSPDWWWVHGTTGLSANAKCLSVYQLLGNMSGWMLCCPPMGFPEVLGWTLWDRRYWTEESFGRTQQGALHFKGSIKCNGQRTRRGSHPIMFLRSICLGLW